MPDDRSAPDYLPVDGRPLRVAMGTRPLDLVDWIEIDEHRHRELVEKDRLLAERPDEVLAVSPDGLTGSAEVLDLLSRHLPERFPSTYRVVDAGLEDRELGRVVRWDSGHPIDVAGRLVQEDLCVMSRTTDGRWLLTAASLCFPSRWRLGDKIGRDLSDIHGPVPFYAERIGGVVQAFFDRLQPERPVWRLNWTLLDDAALFQPRPVKRWTDSGARAGRSLGDLLHLRVERQTLRALPDSGDVLFTIRTYTRPLRELESVRPGAFAELADTLASTPRETVDYKGWTPLIDETIAWLRERSGPRPAESPGG